jgi:hypothetical protein
MESLKKYLGVVPDIPDPRDYFVTTAAQHRWLRTSLQQTGLHMRPKW